LYTVRQQATLKAGLPHVFHFEGLPSDHQLEIVFFLLPLENRPPPDRSVDDHVDIPRYLANPSSNTNTNTNTASGSPTTALPPTTTATTLTPTIGTSTSVGGGSSSILMSDQPQPSQSLTLPQQPLERQINNEQQQGGVRGGEVKEEPVPIERARSTSTDSTATKKHSTVQHNATDASIQPPELTRRPSMGRFGVQPPTPAIVRTLPEAPNFATAGRQLSLASGQSLLTLPFNDNQILVPSSSSTLPSATVTTTSPAATTTTAPPQLGTMDSSPMIASEQVTKMVQDSKSPMPVTEYPDANTTNKGFSVDYVAPSSLPALTPPMVPTTSTLNNNTNSLNSNNMNSMYLMPDSRRAFVRTLPQDDIVCVITSLLLYLC
jgi:hypothetical protein